MTPETQELKKKKSPAPASPRPARAAAAVVIEPKIPKAAARQQQGTADNDEEEEGFLSLHWGKLCFFSALVLGIGCLVISMRGHSAAPPRKAPERQVVSIQLPPPPAPPPKVLPPPPPPKQIEPPKMIEQAPLDKPDEAPKKADDEPPAGLGTNVKGSGKGDGFGLTSSGGGSRMLGGTGTGGARRGGPFDAYAGKVQGRLGEALRNHKKTRAATLNNIKLRVWADATGRITRAQLAAGSGTGAAALDEALRNEVFTGLQLSEAPPAAMPMPIVLRLSARRPN